MPNPAELPEHHEDHPVTISRNSRRGLTLFALYFAMYGSFIAANIFWPEKMGSTSVGNLWLGGPNVAIVTGIGLIFAAFIIALIYMRLTRSTARQ